MKIKNYICYYKSLNEKMNIMNQLVKTCYFASCIVLSVCLLCSCGSSKKAVETDTNVSSVAYDYKDAVFELTQVDVEPKFSGGEKALDDAIQRAIKYPKEAYMNNVSGRVLCSVVIRRDGTIHDVKLLRRADFLLEQEALRVIPMLKPFKPALKNGQPVSARRTILVRFVLPGTV